MTVNAQSGLWEMLWGAGPMVKFVLLLLFFFSVFSWAIIVYKIRLLRKMEKETVVFYDMFWKRRQFSQIYSATKEFRATPLSAIFRAAYAELSSVVPQSTVALPQPPELHKDDLDRIQRALRKAVATETAKLEYAVGFLATTGNTAPFIGLFGTVWGIMSSFRDIGAKGSANLAVVAPGISEALIATAMGLLAAIPAVIGYNHVVSRISRIQMEMENFSSDLLNIIAKQIPK
ncbi:MAG: protein TolQ [Deltaproteobacteria bacterium]|nr:protein TolQ [Deltaproteobacteria bacterium]